MMKMVNYRTAFIAAVAFHFLLIILLTMEHHSDQFVVKSGRQNHMAEASLPIDNPSPEPIRAVSVDSQAVEQTLNRLKEERAQKQQAELDHQHAMEQQLKTAQKKRIQEQQNLERLKKEAAQLAIAQQKKRVAEEKQLKELAHLKAQQEKHIADLKQQQAQIKQQQVQEQQRMAALQKQKDAAAQEQARLAQQAAAKQAAALAGQKSAQMAGEINKYKALIIQSISQHWILPEHVNNQLFCQFRIRLAPNGAVMNVSLTRSSGDPILDRSAQAAINKASPLPVPTDPAMFNIFRDISLTVRPESARG